MGIEPRPCFTKKRQKQKPLCRQMARKIAFPFAALTGPPRAFATANNKSFSPVQMDGGFYCSQLEWQSITFKLFFNVCVASVFFFCPALLCSALPIPLTRAKGSSGGDARKALGLDVISIIGLQLRLSAGQAGTLCHCVDEALKYAKQKNKNNKRAINNVCAILNWNEAVIKAEIIELRLRAIQQHRPCSAAGF